MSDADLFKQLTSEVRYFSGGRFEVKSASNCSWDDMTDNATAYMLRFDADFEVTRDFDLPKERRSDLLIVTPVDAGSAGGVDHFSKGQVIHGHGGKIYTLVGRDWRPGTASIGLR